jgi:hypothetical protein
MPERETLPLLMVYELNDVTGKHHVVCFQDPVLAGSVGVDVRTIVGRYFPTPEGAFDPASFQFNPGFLEVVSNFMNNVAIDAPSLAMEAKNVAGGKLEVIDPRCDLERLTEIPMSEIVGWFAVEDSGTILRDSFFYNHNHVWFDPYYGTSGLLSMRKFYDFVHGSRVEKK